MSRDGRKNHEMIVNIVNKLSRAYSSRIRQDMAMFKLTDAEQQLLIMLYDFGDMRASDVALTLGISEGGRSNLTKGLVKKGLIERQLDQEDPRKVVVCLTPKGKDLARDISVIRSSRTAMYLNDLTERDQASLLALLRLAEECSNDYLKGR